MTGSTRSVSRVPGTRRFGRLGLAQRLFLISALVILAGAGTLLVAALLIAPPLFYSHLQMAQLPEISEIIRDHVDAAFDRALSISLVVGVVVSILTGGALSWLVARRIAAPIDDIVSAGRLLAAGHYETSIGDPRMGPEFASLAASLNQLSHRLATTEADRLRLTSDLAHQLRTPIASVRATLEAVADGVLPWDDATLTTLTSETDRLSRLVADLEKASRAQEWQIHLQPEPQSLVPVLDRCVAAVRARARAAGVELVSQFGAGTAPLPPVRIDGDRIAEALGNVLDNALRHTPSGGRIVIGAAPSADGERPGVRVTVTDTGEGFEPEDAERLFERFYRGSRLDRVSRPDRVSTSAAPHGGSGLGLTIARALIEAHSGTLTAASAGAGRGAEFTITLPADS